MADFKIKPSKTVYPWYGKSQETLNAERSGIPLMTVVDTKAHRRIASIRNSENYQAAHAENARSSLKVPKLKDTTKIGRFVISNSSNQSIKNSASAANTSSSPPIPLVLLNGKHGRFTVSNTEPSIASISNHSVVLPSSTQNGVYGRFTVSNVPQGGLRTRKHRRKNVSRLNRNVRNISRNGAHHGLVRRRHNIK